MTTETLIERFSNGSEFPEIKNGEIRIQIKNTNQGTFLMQDNIPVIAFPLNTPDALIINLVRLGIEKAFEYKNKTKK